MAADRLAGVVSPARAAKQVKTTPMSAAFRMPETFHKFVMSTSLQPPIEASQTLPPGHWIFAGASDDSVLDIPAPVKFAIPLPE